MKNTQPGALHRTALAGCLLLAGTAAATVGNTNSNSVAPDRETIQRVASARVPFIKNEGQVDNPEVQFYATTFAGTV